MRFISCGNDIAFNFCDQGNFLYLTSFICTQIQGALKFISNLRIFLLLCILIKHTQCINIIYTLSIVTYHVPLSSAYIKRAFHCDVLRHIRTLPLSSVSITMNSLFIVVLFC